MDETVTNELMCLTCDVVTEYVDLANSFTQNLSTVLLDPMWFIYLSVVGLWIVIHGGKMIMGKGDLIGFAHEFAFIIIAGLLLGGQGPTLVNSIYQMALSTMGSAAGVVLSAGMEGGITAATIPSEASSLGGMAQLVYVAERGLLVVLRIAFEIWSSISLGNLMAGVYGVLLALPYIILIIVYFSQVVVSIFRVMMFSALSPILMLAVGFGWGRGMAITGFEPSLPPSWCCLVQRWLWHCVSMAQRRLISRTQKMFARSHQSTIRGCGLPSFSAGWVQPLWPRQRAWPTRLPDPN